MKKNAVLVVLLFSSLILHLRLTAAQTPVDTSNAHSATKSLKCEYEEKRAEKVPINPKTNKPYTLDERNQEPFDGGSISENEIWQCLQAKKPIKNHHIVFDNYWKAWTSLAQKTGDYAIPLLIEGGVLHADQRFNEETNTGSIRLDNFRDPTATNASKLTEEERKAFGIEKKDTPIVLIRDYQDLYKQPTHPDIGLSRAICRIGSPTFAIWCY